jgi:type II secretory pathway component GspD/PulD (secretin)
LSYDSERIFNQGIPYQKTRQKKIPFNMIRINLFCALALLFVRLGFCSEINIPKILTLDKIVQIVREQTQVSISVASELNDQLSMTFQRHSLTEIRYLWEVFIQAASDKDIAIVFVGSDEGVDKYRLVPTKDAIKISTVIDAEFLGKMQFPPGYVSLTFSLKFLGLEAATAIASPLIGSSDGIRAMGAGQPILIISGTRSTALSAVQLLTDLDVAGSQPIVRSIVPTHSSPQRAQTTVSAAWASMQKLGAVTGQADILISADGSALLLVGHPTAVAQMERLVANVDVSEPLKTETYRPQRYPIAEVANLIEQVLGTGATDGSTLKLVRDQLTGSLIVTTTSSQHQRIADLIGQLESAPAAAQRQLVTVPVRHRLASELVTTVQELLSAGGGAVVVGAGGAGHAGEPPVATEAPPMTGGSGPNPDGGMPAASSQPTTAPDKGALAQRPSKSVGTSGSPSGAVYLTSDDKTNTILALGTPRQVAEVRSVLEKIDRKTPQVEIETILVTLTDAESLQLGVDIAALQNRASLSLNGGALVGLVTRGVVPPSPSGSGVTLSPGDFAMTVKALEGINKGRSMVRSTMVVDNGSKASLNAVLQQPIGSINSNNNVSTTTYAGTSDAGTQVSITPQITAGDQVTLTFSVQQSSFQTASGDAAGLPPPKLANTLAATTSIPDGHVIALGGISNASTNTSQAGLPFLGRIPLVGWVFGKKDDSANDTRFLIFIRADVLRAADYRDLIHLSRPRAAAMGAADQREPVVQPRFLE